MTVSVCIFEYVQEFWGFLVVASLCFCECIHYAYVCVCVQPGVCVYSRIVGRDLGFCRQKFNCCCCLGLYVLQPVCMLSLMCEYMGVCVSRVCGCDTKCVCVSNLDRVCVWSLIICVVFDS